MLSKISIALRVGFAIVWMGLCLLWYANTFSDYVCFIAGLAGAGAALCVGRVGKFVMFLIDTVRALFAPPSSPEYERSVEGFLEAAKNTHNWVSRNIAAAVGMGTILLLWLAPESMEFGIGFVGLLAIPTATHWPAITRRVREYFSETGIAE